MVRAAVRRQTLKKKEVEIKMTKKNLHIPPHPHRQPFRAKYEFDNHSKGGFMLLHVHNNSSPCKLQVLVKYENYVFKPMRCQIFYHIVSSNRSSVVVLFRDYFWAVEMWHGISENVSFGWYFVSSRLFSWQTGCLVGEVT